MDNEKKNAPKLDTELASKIESISDKETKKQKNFIPVIIAIVITAAVIAGAVLYYNKSCTYGRVYFPMTYINGIDASEKTPDEVRSLIKEKCNTFSMAVKARDRDDEFIKALDTGMHYVAGTELEDILNAQNKFRWFFESRDIKNHVIPETIKIDEDRFNAIVNKLSAFDDSTARKPVNAEIGRYDEKSNSFAIIPEDDGNVVADKEKAKELIRDAFLELAREIDLNGSDDIYAKAEIRSDNSALNTRKQSLDKFVKAKVIYVNSDIILDGNTLQDWIIEDDLGVMRLSEDKIKNFVAMLASVYDTKNTSRKLVTQYGNETTVGGGDFGWQVDQEAEAEELKIILPEGSETEREPIYSSKGIVHGDNDWGDTYVEINLAKQHVFFVKNGELLVSTDCVSGGLQRKAPTPTGIYTIKYKARNAVLRGPRRADGSYEYESPVSYWMPFNKGIGLHDAKWRGRFGGTIYRVDGSHGCVNLPLKKAQAIFENIETGIPVIVYEDDFEIMNMPEDPAEARKKAEEAKKAEESKKKAEAKKAEEVKKKTQQKKTEQSVQQADPVETAPVETVPVETAPEETAPMEWGPAFSNPEPEVTTEAVNMPEDMQ